MIPLNPITLKTSHSFAHYLQTLSSYMLPSNIVFTNDLFFLFKAGEWEKEWPLK